MALVVVDREIAVNTDHIVALQRQGADVEILLSTGTVITVARINIKNLFERVVRAAAGEIEEVVPPPPP